MLITPRAIMRRAFTVAFLLSLAASAAALAAADKPYVMKIALATVDDPLHEFGAQTFFCMYSVRRIPPFTRSTTWPTQSMPQL